MRETKPGPWVICVQVNGHLVFLQEASPKSDLKIGDDSAMAKAHTQFTKEERKLDMDLGRKKFLITN